MEWMNELLFLLQCGISHCHFMRNIHRNAEFCVLTTLAVTIVSGDTCLPKCTLSHLQKSLILTRPALCVECNIETRSCSHCCSGKPISYVYWVCVCSLCYPACNVRAPYCHLWAVQLYRILQYLIKWYDFQEKNVTENKMCVLISSTTSGWEISHSKKKSVGYYLKCMSVCL
jgi:hypothetical protein